MARSIKRSHGLTKVVPATAAAHTVGDLVVESHFVGMCMSTVAVGGTEVLQIDGNYRIKVPASSTDGAILYAPGAPVTNGALLANLTTTNLTLTATGNTPVARVAETPVTVNGNLQADCILIAIGQVAL